jgi:hypothetical protein
MMGDSYPIASQMTRNCCFQFQSFSERVSLEDSPEISCVGVASFHSFQSPEQIFE